LLSPFPKSTSVPSSSGFLSHNPTAFSNPRFPLAVILSILSFRSLPIPSRVRIGLSYKNTLRQEVMAMFREFGTPQVFGTWSVNMSCPGIQGTIGPQQQAVQDVSLFCIGYSREWSRIWNFIHKKWAKRKLGVLRA